MSLGASRRVSQLHNKTSAVKLFQMTGVLLLCVWV